MKKKKLPAPRNYCDICEMFDAHETEDCPVQSGEVDLPAPPRKSKKERKLPAPRMYCDNCEGEKIIKEV
jgi:CAP-Gly domain-containing linker protein 1